MDPAGRYEIVNTIASGDFATVYRGRDRELGREVAIKQIHQQFLTDPRQLERYWREAQLLASLEHPNILTIYDIVRPRGWLILELMRGDLRESTQGEPIDLDYLRVVLLHCLSALRFLHANGVVHGDVKPSNMLLDAHNRVKLGDFGLARRASNQEGSLLKGTTKYMAPELISNQFGPVGPASDLYSLGFSAYELMCGGQFESLFPGLSTFGRDEQISWLMWHAAADRNLPQIDRVLEGVPDDLAHVIQTLVIKDQSRRFQSAEDVMRHLSMDRLTAIGSEPEDLEAEAARAEAARKKRMLRIGAISAMACSLILSLWMLLPSRPEQALTNVPQPTRGIVRNIYLGERTLVIERSEDGRPQEVSVRPRDEILINDKKQLLRDVQPGDRVAIEVYRDASGFPINRIIATRAKLDKGQIKAVDADEGKLIVATGEGGETLVVRVPGSVRILLNAEEAPDGQPVTLGQLKAGDRVEVRHVGGETGRTATELSVLRVVVLEGIVRDVNVERGMLTVARGKDDRAELVTLPFAPKCEVTINQRSELADQLLKPEDLRPGDTARVSHDAQVVRVDAYRILGQAGVVRNIHESLGTLQVLLEGRTRPTNFAISPECKITLAGEPVGLVDLRTGDIVDVTHDSPDASSLENARALSIAAIRPPDPRRWAILVAIQDYDDRCLSPLEYPTADAKLLEQTLIRRYRVPADQILTLLDVSGVRLEQGIPNLLEKVQPEDRVILYVAGHAYRDDDGKIYLAPKDFNLTRLAGSGLSLQWLVDRIEECVAKEKLLLLDSSNAGTGADLRQQPSTAEMLETLEAPSGRAPLRTVTAIASSSTGERGHCLPAKQHGLFAFSLSEGYSGRADLNRDCRLEPTELFAFLSQAMASAGAEIQQSQTPRLFLPDDAPPRLSEEAKKAIRKLAAYLHQDRIDPLAVELEYSAADALAGGELEPKLLYGLLLLKARERSEASLVLDELSIDYPDLLLPVQGLAWMHFDKRTYERGVDQLVELVARIPRPSDPAGPYPDEAAAIFRWAGQLREFADVAEREAYRPPTSALETLDAAVAAHGQEAGRSYREGRDQTRSIVQQFDQRILTEDEAAQARLRVERRQPRSYASFPYDEAAQKTLAGLDE